MTCKLFWRWESLSVLSNFSAMSFIAYIIAFSSYTVGPNSITVFLKIHCLRLLNYRKGILNISHESRVCLFYT